MNIGFEANRGDDQIVLARRNIAEAKLPLCIRCGAPGRIADKYTDTGHWAAIVGANNRPGNGRLRAGGDSPEKKQ